MAQSFIEMPFLEFVITINADKSVDVTMDGELVATHDAKLESMSYIESQVHQRAKLMRREPGEYSVSIENNAKGVIRGPKMPKAASVADEDNQPIEGVVGTVTEAPKRKPRARKSEA